MTRHYIWPVVLSILAVSGVVLAQGGSHWAGTTMVFRAQDGAAATPAYGFMTESGMGCWRAGADDFRCTVNGGTSTAQITASSFNLNSLSLQNNGGTVGMLSSGGQLGLGSSAQIDFSSTAAYGGTPDCGFERSAAGIIECTDGSTGGCAGFQPGSKAFASLGTPANGTIVYCSDCTIANPCAGAGTGALAKRLNGAWVCN